MPIFTFLSHWRILISQTLIHQSITFFDDRITVSIFWKRFRFFNETFVYALPDKAVS